MLSIAKLADRKLEDGLFGMDKRVVIFLEYIITEYFMEASCKSKSVAKVQEC